MPFQPVYIASGKAISTSALAYMTRPASKAIKAWHIYFRITAACARKCGMAKGDGIRLDFDKALGTARLLSVEPHRSTRHLTQTGTSGQRSLTVCFPYTGDVPLLFPVQRKITDLVVMDMSRGEGLVFALPAAHPSHP